MDRPSLFESTDEPLQHAASAHRHAATHSRGKLHGKNIAVKRTVKYLSVCSDPRAYSGVVRAAPDDVIKAICNAALNVEQGDVHLTPQLRILFSAHRAQIAKLTSHRHELKNKRKFVASQRGGFPFIPILIGTALGALGGKLFGGG